jgi:PAS domain S-box-containing protein
MDPRTRDVDFLQRCIDDLITVQALRAGWAGRPAAEIVNTLLGTLSRMLHLEFGYVRLRESIDGAPREFVWVARRVHPAADSAAVRAAISAMMPTDGAAPPRTVPNPFGIGDMSLASFGIGVTDDVGTLLVAAVRADFPTRIQLLLLQVAANQAAIGLQEARRIGEHRRAEEALEQRVVERTEQFNAANADLRLLIEAIPHQVWRYAADETIEYCNQRWTDYTGLSLEQAQRAGWRSWVHPADVARVERAWEEGAKRGAAYEVELRMRRADGEYRRFRSRAVPTYDDEGRLARWLGTNSDIEEQKRAEEALREMETELAHMARLTTLGELAASLAHELNQPLAAVATNAGASLRWLDRPVPNLAQAMDAVRRIASDAQRATDVIAQTRAFVTKSVAARSTVDVVEAVREVLLVAHAETARHRITVREAFADAVPSVLGVRVQLKQVVLNLVMNAIEAMAGLPDVRRTLVIGVEPYHIDGRSVRVSVRDAGIGVAAEDVHRLFGPFYTTKAHGLGMGLSISRSIIDAHGGRLSFSRNADFGTTFEFLLPASVPPQP